MMRRMDPSDGFSLLSVLIAVVLVSLALVALSATMVSVMAFRSEGAARATASRLATAYMEELKTRDPTTLSSEASITIDELGDPQPDGRFARTLVVEAGSEPRSKRVELEVTYPRGRSERGRVELVTIIYEGAGP